MSGTVGSISGSGGNDHEFEILCDTLNGVATRFLRRYVVAFDGTTSVVDTALDGVTTHAISGVVGACPPSLTSPTDECFTAISDGPGYTSGDRIVRITAWDMSVSPPSFKSAVWYNHSAGLVITAAPVWTHLRPCDVELSTITACYKAITVGNGWNIGDTLHQVRITDYTNTATGLTSDVYYHNITQGTTILASAPAIPLPGTDLIECADANFTAVQLCDDNGAFLRFLKVEATGAIVVIDKELDGTTDYVVTGTVKICSADGASFEIEYLCDDVGSFIRHYVRAADGTITINDTGLDGVTAYVVTGTAKQCCCPTTLVELCDTVTGNTVAGPDQVISATVAQDAQQKNTGGVHLNETNLDIGHTSGLTDFITGLRFAIALPQGATITSATVQFNSEGSDSTAASISITGEDADNSVAFVATNNNLTSRPKVAPTVTWIPNAWVNNVAGVDEKSPDLAAILQAIVDRPGWAAGNTLALFFQGDTGHRRGHSLLDGAALAPVLSVTYSTSVTTGTTVTRFYRELDSSGKPTGNNYEVNTITGDMTAYAPLGTVDKCVSTPDTELLVLCDDNRSFLRSIRYDTDGSVASIVDTTLDGTAYTPVGVVKICNQDSGSLADYAEYCGDSSCTSNQFGAPFNYLDHSDPDIQATVSVAGNNRTLNFHFNPDPAAGNWDALAKQWMIDLDAQLAAGRTVILQALTGTNTTFPRTFVLGGARKVSYSATNLTNANIQLTVVDDLTLTDPCEGMNALYAQEPVQTAGTFEVQSGTFTVYEAVQGTGTSTKALRTQPSDCTPIPEQVVLLCDANGQFLRHYQRTAGGSITVTDTTLDGVTVYAPVGGIQSCSAATDALSTQILCDSNTSFLRRYVRSSDGIYTVSDTALDGVTAYTLVGIVKTCVESRKCFTCR